MSIRRMLLGLTYAALLVGVVWSLFVARRWALAELATPESVSQWQAWREDVGQQVAQQSPVRHRVPKSDQPPALVLLRDYFSIMLVGAILFSSLLYWLIAWLVMGMFGAREPSNVSSASTTPYEPAAEKQAAPNLRWRSWPLADYPRWSWLVPLGIVVLGIVLARLSGGWFLGALAVVAIVVTLRQFLLPVSYEITSQGISRCTLGRTCLVPWHVIRAYQPRATGVVLFRRPDPAPIDALRSTFLPYGPDEDETLCALREHLPQATELPG